MEKVMQKRVLIVEDSPDIANLVTLHLRDQNMQAEHVNDGESGLKKAISGDYDLVILDLMLPRMDGMDICREMRSQGVHTPVLMLTARNSELDRVLGLEIGADDYLSKPFSVRELIARVKAILRRVDTYKEDGKSGKGTTLCVGDLELDPDKRRVCLRHEIIELTAKEFDLLWHFASNPGRVYTRGQLLDSVWNHAHDGYEHTVNSHINRLRAKIEDDPAKPQYVLTVWGIGYKFADLETHANG